MSSVSWSEVGCLALAASCGASAAWGVSRTPLPPRPTLGAPGLARTRALATRPWWRRAEPVLRVLSNAPAAVIPASTLAGIERDLRRAGHPLGMTAAELCATAGLAGLITACTAWLVGAGGAPGAFLAALLASVATAVPLLHVREVARRRSREIERHLPATVDLVALALEAGVDFASALREVCARATVRGALLDELQYLLEALRLGRTRRESLRTLAERVPTEPVRRFVEAVVQAEERGNPLASVLRVQAAELRRKRSVVAEEAASRAALWLTLPMMMLLACILLVLIGPFVIGGSKVGP